MMATVKWFGPQVKVAVGDEVHKRIRLVLIHLQNYARRKVSRAQKTSGKGLKQTGLQPSQPGEYPKKVLGFLRRNIRYTINKRPRIIGRFGTNVKYGKHLELGTRKMRRRPWLMRTLVENMSTMRQILGTHASGE